MNLPPVLRRLAARVAIFTLCAMAALCGRAALADTSPSPPTAPPASGPAPGGIATPVPATAPPMPAPPAPAPPVQPESAVPFVFTRPGKRYVTWDLNVEGAGGRVFTEPAQWTGFGRVRAGVLWVRDPDFFTLGVNYEVSGLSSAIVGAQGEWMNLEMGTWGQVGPLFDVAHGGRPGFMASLGWSIVGIEYQGRDMRDADFVSAIYAKLRGPHRDHRVRDPRTLTRATTRSTCRRPAVCTTRWQISPRRTR